MEGSVVVVIGITLVLVIAVAAAMLTYYTSDGDGYYYDGDDGGWGRGYRHRYDGHSEIDRIVSGLNSAVHSGYKYDMDQDEEIEDAADAARSNAALVASLKLEVERNAAKIRELEGQMEDLEEDVDGLDTATLGTLLATITGRATTPAGPAPVAPATATATTPAATTPAATTATTTATTPATTPAATTATTPAVR